MPSPPLLSARAGSRGVVAVGTMSVCFFVNWGAAHTDTASLLSGWGVPEMPYYAVTQAVGTIGAVIMPHNLYLHSGIVLSRKIRRDKPNRVHNAIWYNRIESAGALLMSFFINLALVAVNANEFYSEKCAALDEGLTKLDESLLDARRGTHQT